jgi:hypothetical protein
MRVERSAGWLEIDRTLAIHIKKETVPGIGAVRENNPGLRALDVVVRL